MLPNTLRTDTREIPGIQPERCSWCRISLRAVRTNPQFIVLDGRRYHLLCAPAAQADERA